MKQNLITEQRVLEEVEKAISEGIDINPVMALEKGAVAVDARISLAKE